MEEALFRTDPPQEFFQLSIPTSFLGFWISPVGLNGNQADGTEVLVTSRPTTCQGVKGHNAEKSSGLFPFDKPILRPSLTWP
jgi:hypothetical protein